MANKQALRDLQARLAERLQVARTQVRGRSWLAVESAGAGFLFPLHEAGEIHSLAEIQGVPHSHPWFLGVANLRGHLHGVVELAAFLGLRPPAPARAGARLVGFNESLDLNCVLLVDRLCGLRGEADLTPDGGHDAAPGARRPGFAGGRLRDAVGRSWQELSLVALAADEAFLTIVD